MQLHQVSLLEASGSPMLPLLEGEGTVAALVWPGMGARHRSLHHIDLPPGGRLREQCHPGEAVYYVIEGEAVAIDSFDGSHHTIVQGAMIHIEPETPYILATEHSSAEIVGGPCPPDPSLYKGLR